MRLMALVLVLIATPVLSQSTMKMATATINAVDRLPRTMPALSRMPPPRPKL